MNFDRSNDPNQILSGVGEIYFADQTFENIFEAAALQVQPHFVLSWGYG